MGLSDRFRKMKQPGASYLQDDPLRWTSTPYPGSWDVFIFSRGKKQFFADMIILLLYQD